MMRKNQADMEKFREDLMGKSRKEADELKADARRSIEEEKNKAVAELKGPWFDVRQRVRAAELGQVVLSRVDAIRAACVVGDAG